MNNMNLIKTKNFKFIYFDVGGVVIKDFSGTDNWQKLKNELGIKPHDIEKFDNFFDSYEEEVCTTRDINTLIPLIEKEFEIKLPENYNFLNAFVDKFERNESIWEVLNKAKEKYKVGLLTNMYPNMFSAISKRRLFPNIDWDVVVDSSVVKACKPNKEIFDIAEEKAKVKPSEILFIDNGKKHLEAAKLNSWQIFLYDSKNIVESNSKLAELL